ncbi:VOC family protein [Streptomyces sp. NPDC058373]|uniref:VOC family protein n=1 Tax=Streptomyces sp. NPDC058373 TaxID=3346465 RepID=UPI003650E448
MSPFPEGAPCWADAMFPDVAAARGFYGQVLGWTFDEEHAEEYGGYTMALMDGEPVAAVMPVMPGADVPALWNLYLATSDAAAATGRVEGLGGTVVMGPEDVGGFGTTSSLRDPAGVAFGLWQPGGHPGFGLTEAPGAYAWAEVNTRDPAATDGFFPELFGYEVGVMEDPGTDFRVWSAAGRPVLGRMAMTDDFPPEVPSYVNVYFSVPDCDTAVETAVRLGGQVHHGPVTTPFGRFAAVSDQQGAAFSVIDAGTTAGETPPMT